LKLFTELQFIVVIAQVF